MHVNQKLMTKVTKPHEETRKIIISSLTYARFPFFLFKSATLP